MGARDVVQSDILVWVLLLSGTVVMFADQDLVAMVKSREGQSTIYTLIRPSLELQPASGVNG